MEYHEVVKALVMNAPAFNVRVALACVLEYLHGDWTPEDEEGFDTADFVAQIASSLQYREPSGKVDDKFHEIVNGLILNEEDDSE